MLRQQKTRRDRFSNLSITSLSNLCIATLLCNVAQLSRWAARNNLLRIEVPVVFLIVSTLAAGLFAGAAIYVSAVEHPARVSCGTDLAVREFAPSYKRGAIMQASALVGCVTGLSAGGS
jgi:hypothetical protein